MLDTLRVNNVVVLVEDGVREDRTIDEEFEIRIRSTTTVQETGSETH